jgi:universal stress protein A
MHNYQTILVPVDFSHHSETAVARAANLAAVYHADIELFHVAEAPTYPVLEDIAVTGVPGIWDVELTQTILEAAQKRLEKIAADFHLKPEQCKTVVGVPSVDIVARAEEIDAELIVMGRHGFSFLEKLIGSTTDAVLHDAKCDVMAVYLDKNKQQEKPND